MLYANVPAESSSDAPTFFNFLGNIIQQMFYQLWKFELYKLIINHFTCITKTIYVVCNPAQSPLSSVTFHNVTFLLLLSIHFWLSTQKSNTNLNNILYINIKYDELLSEIDNVYKNGEFNLTMHVSIITIKEFSFSYIHATPLDNVT